MIFRMARFLSICACIATLSGCATALQPKTLATNTNLTKTLQLKSHDVSGQRIKEERARQAVADALIKAGDKPTDYTEPFFTGTTHRTWGVRSKATDNSITVEYIDGFRLNTGYSSPVYNQSREVAIFPLAFKETADNYEMVLTFPSRVDMVPNDPGPFNPINEYYLPESKIVPNLLSKFNAVNDDWVAFAYDPNVRGEVTVDFGPEAVRGNLDRKFQKVPTESESDSTRTYYLPTQRETLQLEVKLFPYRNGCRMQYAAPLLRPLTQGEMADIRRQVEAVAKE